MSFSNFAQVETIFSKLKISKIYIKNLSSKETNRKGIRLGTEDVFHVLPTEIIDGLTSTSTKKKSSDKGRPILRAKLNFYWLDKKEKLHHAPFTKLIFYFQYPEARLSGFLEGSTFRPDCLRDTKCAEYGKRFLLFGINQEDKVIALTINEKEDPIGSRFPKLDKDLNLSTLYSHDLSLISPFDELQTKMKNITGKWHSSIKLKSIAKGPQPCKGNQCGGWTLEALLGIEMNSRKTPDFRGIEIKSYKKSPITLMTPEPDGVGERASMTFREYLHTFGKKSEKKIGRITFTGPFWVSRPDLKKDYYLRLVGFDSSKKNPFDFNDIFVGLFRESDDKLVSSWTGNKLLEHWIQKHSEALYVEYESRSLVNDIGETVLQYRFKEKCIYCKGTTLNKFFDALDKNLVGYDPIDEIYPDGREKRRSQWRVTVPKFRKNKDVLYDHTETINM